MSTITRLHIYRGLRTVFGPIAAFRLTFGRA